MAKYTIFFWLLICLAHTGCIKNKDYVLNDGLEPGSIIRIASVTPGYITADSHTAVIIRVAIAPSATEAYAVTLQTDRGYFSNDSQAMTQTVNMERYTDFILHTGSSAGPANITAVVKDDLKTDTLLYFNTSYPDTLIITPEHYVMAGMTEQDISLKLFKAKGYASAAPVLQYSAADSMGNPAGTLEESMPYVPGNDIRLKFTPAAGFTGTVTLQAVLFKENATTITGRSRILIP